MEKYLKAWLTEHDVEFPRTHDLPALAKLCFVTFPELIRFLPGLNFLTSAAVEVRYPGTSTERVDAEECIRIARELRDTLRQKFYR